MLDDLTRRFAQCLTAHGVLVYKVVQSAFELMIAHRVGSLDVRSDIISPFPRYLAPLPRSRIARFALCSRPVTLDHAIEDCLQRLIGRCAIATRCPRQHFA
jgi:hypothetical protein